MKLGYSIFISQTKKKKHIISSICIYSKGKIYNSINIAATTLANNIWRWHQHSRKNMVMYTGGDDAWRNEDNRRRWHLEKLTGRFESNIKSASIPKTRFWMLSNRQLRTNLKSCFSFHSLPKVQWKDASRLKVSQPVRILILHHYWVLCFIISIFFSKTVSQIENGKLNCVCLLQEAAVESPKAETLGWNGGACKAVSVESC